MMTQTLLAEPIRHPIVLPNTELFREAFEVVSQLRQAGHDAFLVGGAIRDTLMGRIPGDCDITTSALPEEVIELFPRTAPVGIQFGTVMVLKNGHHFEVTTFRADGRYEDGRRPTSVAFSEHVTDDLERRDLTINGLIYAPETQEVLDYTGGIADIHDGIIRTIGSPQERFQEDRLRTLRAVRFAARLSFQLAPQTFAAIRALAPRIRDVSVERIQQELLKIITCEFPARGVLLLEETGLLAQIVPELPRPTKAVHRMLHYESQRKPNKHLALALLLADLTPPLAEQVTRSLCFPNEYATRVHTLLEQRHQIKDYAKKSIADRKRFLRQPYIQDIFRLGVILQDTDEIPTEALEQAIQEEKEWSQEELNPAALLNGHDLRARGYPPGPSYKEILLHLENEQLHGIILTREQAEEWLEKHYSGLRHD